MVIGAAAFSRFGSVGSDAVRVIEIYRVMLRLGLVIAVIACLNRGGFTGLWLCFPRNIARCLISGAELGCYLSTIAEQRVGKLLRPRTEWLVGSFTRSQCPMNPVGTEYWLQRTITCA